MTLKCIEPLVEIILVNCNFTIEIIFRTLLFSNRCIENKSILCLFMYFNSLNSSENTTFPLLLFMYPKSFDGRKREQAGKHKASY